MNKRLTISLGMAILLLAPAWALAQNNGADLKTRSRGLAKNIDKYINMGLDQAGIAPGVKADLGRIARRLHLDLVGRIPTVVELHDLIDETNDSPTKYEDRVDALLSSHHYASNFAHYWRSVMLGNSNGQPQPQFEGWARNRLFANTGYDVMVREVLLSQGVPGQQQPGNQQGNLTPVAFYQVNQGVENAAGATARVFMGVKIECAQCHKHPFASWTRKQFWEMAAFFQNNNSGQIKIPLTDQVAKARYLTGDEPDMKGNTSLRVTLAEWMTTPNNPYFAKAAVDHVWQYFFGVSLIEPILEPTIDSPEAHPELLDEMAKEFAASGFDLKFLIRSIVLSDAYQRVSVGYSEKSKVELQMFAKMPVRGMMPEQLFDSICVATNMKQTEPVMAPQGPQINPLNQQNNQTRNQFLAMFNSQDKKNEAQTSILQALYMMNGPFVLSRYGHALNTIGTQNTSTERRVEAIYMLTLSRMPTSSERELMVKFINDGGGSGDPAKAVADVCWVLLNSSEFLLNH